ncbi:MAG: hypothetical protein LAN59_10790 [Acidobacteriia bacterium]|nr:hypothetical protein [Terriglobia bacterium]
MNAQTNESGEKVSLIQSLTDRTQDLGRSIDNWNTAYIVLVALTVVLAVGVFIAQLVVIKKSKLLATAQRELLAVKDRQAAVDSQNKDVQIEGAKHDAAEANVLVLKLREKLANRRLTAEQQREIASKLHAFAGQMVNVNPYAGDTEGIGLAEDIAAALGPKGAGWVVSYLAIQPTQTTVSGILVEVAPNATDTIKDAAKAIVAAIGAERLDISGPQNFPGVRTYAAFGVTGRIDFSIPISITVGKKPN